LFCRTQGLPLLYQAEDEVKEVDFCHLNFSTDGVLDELEEEFLFPLDWMNEELVLINLTYCQSTGIADPGHRIPLRQILMEVCLPACQILIYRSV
jgi:uncharacterized protein